MAAPQTRELDELAAQLEAKLMKEYGPLMTGKPLTAALGYTSQDAFRQAIAQDSLPIRVFPIEKHRGKYALSQDVARWLAEQRLGLPDHESRSIERSTSGGCSDVDITPPTPE